MNHAIDLMKVKVSPNHSCKQVLVHCIVRDCIQQRREEQGGGVSVEDSELYISAGSGLKTRNLHT